MRPIPARIEASIAALILATPGQITAHLNAMEAASSGVATTRAKVVSALKRLAQQKRVERVEVVGPSPARAAPGRPRVGVVRPALQAIHCAYRLRISAARAPSDGPRVRPGDLFHVLVGVQAALEVAAALGARVDRMTLLEGAARSGAAYGVGDPTAWRVRGQAVTPDVRVVCENRAARWSVTVEVITAHYSRAHIATKRGLPGSTVLVAPDLRTCERAAQILGAPVRLVQVLP